MFGKAVNWLKANVWLAVSIVLAVVLVVVLLVPSGETNEPGAGGSSQAADPSSPTTVGSGSSGDTSSDSLPVGGSEPAEGVGSGGGFLAVKIDNDTDARPQVGIAEAPLLVEVPVEGGMTRFVAVFPQGASTLVGPIRSLRPVDEDLLPALAIHVVSTGGQPFVTQAVEATGIQRIEPRFFDQFQSGGREAPHDTFLDLDLLMQFISGEQVEAPGLPIGELPAAAGSAASIGLPYGSVEYRFEAGEYLRYVEGEVFEVLDSLDGQSLSLAYDTVVVMSVAERPAGYEDSNDVPVSTFDVIGRSDLLVFHDGDMFEGTWARAAHADPILFYDSEGRQFGIPEGSTYLALVPRDLETVFTP